MLLDVDNTIPYLLDRGLLSPRDVTDTGVRVSRTNRSLRVVRRNGTGLLVKQAEAAGSRAGLRTEAAFYRMCREDARGEAVRALVPALAGVDDAHGAIAIELAGRGAPLASYRARFDEALLEHLGGAIGGALGTYHRVFRSLAEAPPPELEELASDPPWVLGVERAGTASLRELSPAHRKTLRILQDSGELGRQLERLRAAWRIETVIHGGIHADDLVVVWRDDEPAIQIVDWDCVQLGDPAWDVAAICRDFIAYWIRSMPIARGRAIVEMMAAARQPLAGFQRGLRAMWARYVAAAELSPGDADRMLIRVSSYGAASLVQAAYEQAQHAAVLGNHEVVMLQIAANVLVDPADAALHLFGIPMLGARG